MVRILTSVFFLFFGEYKLASSAFAHSDFQQYLQSYISNDAVSFYRPFLSGVVLPHAVFFGYFVGVLELLIGISLLIGLWVRPASVAGALFMLNLALSIWWSAGHSAPFWRHFGVELDALPMLFLFVIFYAADAGKVWGLDGFSRR